MLMMWGMCGVALLAAASAVVPAAWADPLVVHTGQETYAYGDRLHVTIRVEEVDEPFATMRIQDSQGRSSSPILIPITGPNATFPAPGSFDREVFQPGRYTVLVEYSGFEARAAFDLVDTGNVVVPNWIKQIAFHWISGGVPGEGYAGTLGKLSDQGMLDVPETEAAGFMPAWVMEPTDWWLRGLIDDAAYVALIQYLVDRGVAVLGADAAPTQP